MPEKKTVLLVDDEPEYNETMTRVIERQGYNAITAKNPQAALSILATQKVDVVLTDVHFNSIDRPVEKLVHYCQRERIGIAFYTGVTTSVKTQYEKAVEVIAKPSHIGEILLGIYKASRIYDQTVPPKKTVLILTEEAEDVHKFDFSLPDAGYNILNAGNDLEVKQILRKNEHIDIVVMGKYELSIFRRAAQEFSEQGAAFVFIGEPDQNVKIPTHRVFQIRKEDIADVFNHEKLLAKVKQAEDALRKVKLEKKTLLYIEDDKDLRETLKRNLSLEPYKVLATHSIALAEDLTEMFGIDAIMLDLKLKESSTQEVFEFLKRMRGLGVEIIFLTGAVLETKQAAEEKEITARILEKPVNPNRIRKAIEEALERSPDWGEGEILLLEDEPIVVQTLEKELSVHGFRTKLCKRLDEANEAIGTGRVVAAILDIFYDQGHEPTREYMQLARDCLAKGIITAFHTSADYGEQPKIEGITIFEKGSHTPPHEMIFEIKRRILEQKGRPQQISDEQLERVCDPEWHLSSPTAKWLDSVLSNPKSSKVEREIAFMTMDLPLMKKEIEESARHGEWPKRELNELVDKYHETLERLAWIRHKLHGTKLPDELRLRKRQI